MYLQRISQYPEIKNKSLFLLGHMACEILVSQPGKQANSLHWEQGVLTTGLPGKLPRMTVLKHGLLVCWFEVSNLSTWDRGQMGHRHHHRALKNMSYSESIRIFSVPCCCFITQHKNTVVSATNNFLLRRWEFFQ